MATYIVVLDFTDQGIKSLRSSTDRADAFLEEAESMGAKIQAQYWTVGAHDGVLILDAPDDETATALVLSLASHGSVRTQLLRAFDRSEIEAVLNKIP
ncbi:MAG: GYD domain-containing protein [Thermoanaerobaculia bacterium]